ncbi:MAG: hypothetical protein DDT31_00255 [Syntrophomonadaceae bacterium]|nr:hypothetical protein [Bacillota bacterium]
MHLLPEVDQKAAYERFVYESGRAATEIGFWLFDSKRAARVKEKGHCHENYNALSGEGCDVHLKQEVYDEGFFMGSAGSDRSKLEAWRDGKRIVFAEPGVNIRNYEIKKDKNSFKIKGKGATLLKIGEFKPFEKLKMSVDEVEKTTCISDENGAVNFKINLEEKYAKVLISRVYNDDP